MYPTIQLKINKEDWKTLVVLHIFITQVWNIKSNSLNACSIAIGTRSIVVLVNQTRNEIRGYTNDQSISNDRKHTNCLQHFRPNTWKGKKIVIYTLFVVQIFVSLPFSILYFCWNLSISRFFAKLHYIFIKWSAQKCAAQTVKGRLQKDIQSGRHLS